MRFSVVTPSLNRLSQIRRAVGSVRGQHGVDVHHIVQDGGSTDGTAEWLSGQQDLDVRSGQDQGMYDAINRGWERAHGDVFSWLNTDEQYLPGTLKLVRDIFTSFPDVALVYGHAVVVDEGGNPVAARREIPLRHLYVRNSFLNVYSCTMFFRRPLWESGLLKLDASFRYAADADMILRQLEAGVPMRHLQKYLALFEVGTSNLSAHDAMQEELARVRQTHGCMRFRWQRGMAMLGRYVERFLRGYYMRESVEFDYAVNERPEYRHVQAHGVTGRFDLRKYFEQRGAHVCPKPRRSDSLSI